MTEEREIPLLVPLRGRVVELDAAYRLQPGMKGYIVLDFDRKYANPDLNVLPARLVAVHSPEEDYLVRKYEVLLGGFDELWST